LDENQQPIHYDTFSQTVRPGVLYTNNGFWDTYKTVYPLFSLIAMTASIKVPGIKPRSSGDNHFGKKPVSL
jgi:putative alpha-1,2-mannosidase